MYMLIPWNMELSVFFPYDIIVPEKSRAGQNDQEFTPLRKSLISEKPALRAPKGALAMDRADLIKGLKGLSPSVLRLFSLMPEEKLEWRPVESMRTLLEVANHLAQIPSVDLAILNGAPHAEVQELERALFKTSPAGLGPLWEGGLERLEQFYIALSPGEYAGGIGRAFYGHEATYPEWLLEIITHGYHHRSQLFTYLKILGAPVDMSTLYS